MDPTIYRYWNSEINICLFARFFYISSFSNSLNLQNYKNILKYFYLVLEIQISWSFIFISRKNLKFFIFFFFHGYYFVGIFPTSLRMIKGILKRVDLDLDLSSFSSLLIRLFSFNLFPSYHLIAPEIDFINAIHESKWLQIEHRLKFYLIE